ncbi:MAG: ATP-binding protein, partial [Pseudomonadota bacterium]
TPEPFEIYLRRAKVDDILPHLPTAAIGNVALPIIMCGVIIASDSHPLPLEFFVGWLFCCVAVTAMSFGFWARWRRTDKDALDHACVLKALITVSAVRGAVSGIGYGLALLDQNLVVVILAFQILAGLCAAASAIHYAQPRATLLFDGGLMIVPIGILLTMNDAMMGLLVAPIVTYLVAMSLFSKAAYAGFERRTRAEFDRLQLLERERAMRLELDEERRRADKAHATKSEFFTHMSHEIRTPLNGVIGTLGLLLESDLKPENRQLLRLSKESAQSLLTIINDFLDASRMEAGALTIKPRTCNPQILIHEAAVLLRPSIEDKGLTLTIETDSDLPESAQLDTTRVKQVLYNLIGNASKFTERGGVTVRARRVGDERLGIDVSDTGIGMPADRVRRIFDRFYQAPAAGQERNSAGLGLFITKGLVDLMGGSINCQSTEGVGTRFSVELPLKAAAQTEAGTQTEAPSRHAPAA